VVEREWVSEGCQWEVVRKDELGGMVVRAARLDEAERSRDVA
jgi:hypothetical protein